MPLDFPTSPTDGQAYNGYVYSTSVGAWQAKPSAQSPFYTRDTPPSNPVVGDSWFNTNDGTMYIYTYDGNSYQWVEHRSQIAKSQVGIVPIVPTSIAVGSGTGSVDVSGNIVFTGISSISLNGIFTSAYQNYKIVFEVTTVTTDSTEVRMRYRAAGTDNSAASYGQTWMISRANGTTATNNGWGNPQGGITRWWSTTNSFTSFIADVLSPQIAKATKFIFAASGWDVTSQFSNNGMLIHESTSQFDGITIYSTAGAMTGTMKVYGYN